MSVTKRLIWRISLILISLVFLSSVALPALAAEPKGVGEAPNPVDTVTSTTSSISDGEAGNIYGQIFFVMWPDDAHGLAGDMHPDVGAYEQPPDIALAKDHLDFDCGSISTSNPSGFARSHEPSLV